MRKDEFSWKNLQNLIIHTAALTKKGKWYTKIEKTLIIMEVEDILSKFSQWNLFIFYSTQIL